MHSYQSEVTELGSLKKNYFDILYTLKVYNGSEHKKVFKIVGIYEKKLFQTVFSDCNSSIS